MFTTRSRIARRTPVPEVLCAARQRSPLTTTIKIAFPQPGRSERGGRMFKSCHSDQLSSQQKSSRGMIWGTKPYADALAVNCPPQSANEVGPLTRGVSDVSEVRPAQAFLERSRRLWLCHKVLSEWPHDSGPLSTDDPNRRPVRSLCLQSSPGIECDSKLLGLRFLHRSGGSLVSVGLSQSPSL